MQSMFLALPYNVAIWRISKQMITSLGAHFLRRTPSFTDFPQQRKQVK
jgi:hypothetical protein